MVNIYVKILVSFVLVSLDSWHDFCPGLDLQDRRQGNLCITLKLLLLRVCSVLLQYLIYTVTLVIQLIVAFKLYQTIVLYGFVIIIIIFVALDS